MQWIIANVTPAYSGKYYVTTTNGSCNRTDSTVAIVNGNPFVTVDKGVVALCEGDSVELTASGANTYSWSPANGLTSVTGKTVHAFPSDSAVYTVTGMNGNCRDTAFVTINVYSKPVANAGADKSIMEGSAVSLSGMVTGDSISYNWTPVYNITGLQSLTPIVSPASDTSYLLHVISEAGCGSDVDAVRVNVYKKLTIPNAFSPNKDGINDRWTIKGIDSYKGANVVVFNRFGQPVFRSQRFTSWDGKHNGRELPVGVYYYVIELHGDFPVVSGWVAILL
jgi:gliding motility-associated-like protein